MGQLWPLFEKSLAMDACLPLPHKGLSPSILSRPSSFVLALCPQFRKIFRHDLLPLNSFFPAAENKPVSYLKKAPPI
jgi:hypothetical protein